MQVGPWNGGERGRRVAAHTLASSDSLLSSLSKVPVKLKYIVQLRKMRFEGWFGYTITYRLGWIVSRAMVAGSLRLLGIYSLLLPYLRVFSQKVSYLTCPLCRC